MIKGHLNISNGENEIGRQGEKMFLVREQNKSTWNDPDIFWAQYKWDR